MELKYRLSRIEEKRKELQLKEEKELIQRRQTIEGLKEAIHALAPRIKDLIEIYKALKQNNFTIGCLVDYHGSRCESLVANGITHEIGFSFVGGWFGRSDGTFQGVGIEGGGIADTDLIVDEYGGIVDCPLHHIARYRCYENACIDFCNKSKNFLANFEIFEKKVNNYVDNL